MSRIIKIIAAVNVLMLAIVACGVFPAPSGVVEARETTAATQTARPSETDSADPTDEPSRPTPTWPTPTQPTPTTTIPVVIPQPVPPTQPSGPQGEEFDQRLGTAIITNSFPTMRSMMRGSFTLVGWRTDYSEKLSAADAILKLQSTFLAQGSRPAVIFSQNVADLMQGADPLVFFSSDGNPVRAFLVSGLGTNGQDEGLAIIGSDPVSGQRYWLGMKVVFGGFPRPQSDNFEVFSQKLFMAIRNRDFDTQRTLMHSRFAVLNWPNGLLEVSADEAMVQIHTHFAPGSAPVVKPSTDVVALLNGADPLTQWGPNTTNLVRAVHVTGLGSTGVREAVVVIGRDAATGRYYWHGMIVPLDGSFHSSSQIPVNDTAVKWALAKEDVNVRSGPGLAYGVIGMVRGGEVAAVTGVSLDGGWWRFQCNNDTSGNCWISADPTLTQPVVQP